MVRDRFDFPFRMWSREDGQEGEERVERVSAFVGFNVFYTDFRIDDGRADRSGGTMYVEEGGR